MKIALVVHCFFPAHYHGTEVYTRAVAKELLALGHEPTVVTATWPHEPGLPNPVEEYVFDGIPVVMIDRSRIPHHSIRESYEQPAMRDLHRAILKRLGPDIVHVCHLANHSATLLETADSLGMPVTATLTDFFGFCYKNTLEGADGSLCQGPSASRDNCIACVLAEAAKAGTADLKLWLATRPLLMPTVCRYLAYRGTNPGFEVGGFRPGDLVSRPGVLAAALRSYRFAVAPTQFLKQAYERNRFPAPLVLSHFGIDIDRSPKPVRAPGDGPIRLGFIGQIAPHKGLHILIDALRQADRSNLALSVWGALDQDPAYSERLRQASHGLPVRFEGVFDVKDTARVLAGIDVLVLPSTWYENSPLIMLQALATHTPVVVSDVPGMTEFIRDGHNGFHFRRLDTRALAAVLQRIADTEGLARELSSRSDYPRTQRDMVKDLVSNYERVLDVSSPHGRGPYPV